MASSPSRAADQIAPTARRTVLSLDHVSRSFGEGEQRAMPSLTSAWVSTLAPSPPSWGRRGPVSPPSWAWLAGWTSPPLERCRCAVSLLVACLATT